MVSIEERSTYLYNIKDNHLLNAFQCFLKSENLKGILPDDLNEIDKIYFDAIKAIETNSQGAFDIPYKLISKRLPTKNSNSPFVYNDYLLFVLIVGIIKFNYDQAWIKQIIGIRTKNKSTITFENILKEDFLGKSNSYEVTYSFLKLVNPAKTTKELQDDTYQSIVNNTSLFHDNNDFLIICSLNAYDNIITSRQIVDRSQLDELIRFEARFLKRIEILSYIVYNILLIFVFYSVWKLLSISPTLKNEISDFGLVFTMLGIGLANFLKSVPAMLKKGIVKVFGYFKKI